MEKCLAPIRRRERRFLDICVLNMRLRNNVSNAGRTCLFQILVTKGDGEMKTGDRKEIGNRNRESL